MGREAAGDGVRLDQLVDTEALVELCRSFFELFGVSIRVVGRSGAVLADIHRDREVCKFAHRFEGGRTACTQTLDELRGIASTAGSMVLHQCFTGAVYRVMPITQGGRILGRFIVGPYKPSEGRDLPRALLSIDPAVEPDDARAALADMPRVNLETAERLTRHLRELVELLVRARASAPSPAPRAPAPSAGSSPAVPALGHTLRGRGPSELALPAAPATDDGLATRVTQPESVDESYRLLQQKNRELVKAYERLAELDRLKSNFLATVSHELRTPLTSVIGYSEMLATGVAGPLNPEQKEFADIIRQKADDLLQLITSLLDLSRLEEGNVTLKIQVMDPLRVIHEAETTMIPVARRRGVTLELAVERPLPKVLGDPVRIRQILVNLLDNAMKFAPKGSTVRFGAKRTEFVPAPGAPGPADRPPSKRRSGIELAVSDTGVGIAPEQHERIFDAFYQVDGGTTRAHGGAGLGLSIVKKLVDAHGGTIRVESALGRGATFRVALPEADPELPA